MPSKKETPLTPPIDSTSELSEPKPTVMLPSFVPSTQNPYLVVSTTAPPLDTNDIIWNVEAVTTELLEITPHLQLLYSLLYHLQDL